MKRALSSLLAFWLSMPAGFLFGDDAPPGPLMEGNLVRLEAPSVSSKRVVGRVLAAQGGGLRLKLADGRQLDVARADIVQLEVSGGRRSHTRTGALIGALGGAGYVALATVSEGGCDPDMGGCPLYFLAGAIWAAGGGLVGALVGSQVKTDRWERVPEQPRVTLVVGPTARKGAAVRVSIAF